MKTKLLIIIACLFACFYANAQYTSIPDPNFEQELITQNIDSEGTLDGQILTADIVSITALNLAGTSKPENKKITDLTGIQNFTALTDINCNDNNITSLDVTQNKSLQILRCSNNLITDLDLSNISTITFLSCLNNQIPILDLRLCSGLTLLNCRDNALTFLDISNGNNANITFYRSENNPNLECITLDTQNIADDWNTNTNIPGVFSVDPISTFSEDCTLPFITTWETITTNESITIPTTGTGYNYDVDWNNDGTFDDLGITGNATHTYPVAGTYTVAIRGDFPRIYFNNTGSKNKIISIEQWGNNPWSSMQGAFHGCSNLIINAPDSPVLSNVTDMSRMFAFCSSFNQNISSWDVSNVINMAQTFRNTAIFNKPITAWDVSNVTNMESMFWDSNLFNRDIGAWDVGNVTNMTSMFRSANNFNQDIGAWDVSKVTNMSLMFAGAVSFDQNLENWDISRITSGFNNGFGFVYSNNMNQMLTGTNMGVTNYDLTLIGWNTLSGTETDIPRIINFGAGNTDFCTSTNARNNLINNRNWRITDGNNNCTTAAFTTRWSVSGFNPSVTIYTAGSDPYRYTIDWGDGTRNINITGSISHTYTNPGIYTVNVYGKFPRFIAGPFSNAQKLLSVNKWGDKVWKSMANSFQDCYNMIMIAPDRPNLTEVTSFRNIFRNARNMNQNINLWDVSNVTDMIGVFEGAYNFNQFLNSWDVSNVTNMAKMFDKAYNFNGNISGWNVGKVTNMYQMFNNASNFNQNIGNWDVSKVSNMGQMFLTANSYDQNLGNWDISMVNNMTQMLNNTSISVDNYDSTLIGWNTLSMGEDRIPRNLTLNALSNRYCVGENARNSLTNSPSNWTITDSGQLCSSAFITTWKTDSPGVTNDNTIQIPTEGIESYNYNVDWGDGTTSSNLTASSTHTYATAGTYTVTITGDFPRIYFINTGDKQKIQSVEQWGTNAWSSMQGAFHGCSNLVVNAADNPDLSNVTDMSFMFTFCSSFNQNISTWDVSNVTNMAHTFRNTAIFNKPITTWDVSNVTNMESMFWNSNLFNRDIGAWDVGNVTNMTSMFRSANNFNQDIGAWDVSKVTNMSLMFAGAVSFDQNLGNWDISSINNMGSMFFGNALSVLNYDATLIGWSTLSGTETQIPENITFNGANSQYCIGENARNTLMTTPLSWNLVDAGQACTSAFITTWKTNNVGVSSNTSLMIPVEGTDPYNYNVDWGDGSVSMGLTGAFTHNYATPGTYIIKITGEYPRFWAGNIGDKDKLLSVEQWGDQVWTSMQGSFYGCSNLVINATDTPNLSQVATFANIFRNASSLNQSTIGNWDVSTVTTMGQAFNGATTFNQDLSSWDTSNVTSTLNMFTNATAFNQDISSWDLGNVTNMANMFRNAIAFNQNIRTWNVSNVTLMSRMFENASSFNQDLSGWDVSSVSDMTNMFNGVLLSITNYDNTLIGWNTLEVGETQIPTGITFSGGNSKYCGGESARGNLIGTHDWTIIDKGLDCPTLGTNDVTFQDLSVFPNPVKSNVTISLQDNATYTLFDINGRLVKNGALIQGETVLNLSELSNGLYLLKLSTDNQTITRKIIKE